MRHRLHSRVVCVALALISSACVSSGKYDDAVKNADDARAKLRQVTASDQVKINGLQRWLDEATAENASLRAELGRLGADTEALSAEKGSLASALGESKRRLEELRRAQAAAEARARLYRELALKLKKMVDAGDLRIGLRDGRMVLQLPTDVLFDTGQTDIKPRGREALKQLAAVLKTLDSRQFQVAGHTDNVPIATVRFPSNWELSSARGLEVVHFLVAQSVPPGVLSAAGYGEFDPVAPNDDPQGRAKNRRIEITLQPNVDEIVTVPESR
jgi:chemotaxis protein MotB